MGKGDWTGKKGKGKGEVAMDTNWVKDEEGIVGIGEIERNRRR